MDKWIIEMPEGHVAGHYSSCPFYNDYCRREAKCSPTCPLANAQEVVEVDPEIQDVEIGLPVVEAPFKTMMVNKEPVTLYSVKREEK